MEELVTGLLFEYFFRISFLEQVYLVCALLGGLGFVLQVVGMMLGLGDGHIDLHGGDMSVSDFDAGYKVLSVQGIAAFFLMFGLVGFVLLKEGMTDNIWSMVWATLSGLGGLALVSALFAFFSRMQSSGTMKVENAIGQQGRVYLTIPAGGTGKVIVTVQESQREFDAVSANNEEIPTDDRIKVVGIEAGVLIVEKLSGSSNEAEAS